MSQNKTEQSQTHFASPQKYGDGDVCSKRRKLEEINARKSNATFTTATSLSSSSPTTTPRITVAVEADELVEYESFAGETCLNSTFLEHLQENLDFKGGLLNYGINNSSSSSIRRPFESKQKSTASKAVMFNEETPLTTNTSPTSTTSSTTGLNTKSAKTNDLIITTKPSPASKGFENTFKLLENHVNNSNKNYQRGRPTTTQSGSYDLGALTRLDLELEAQQRLQMLYNKENDVGISSKETVPAAAFQHKNCDNSRQNPLIGFLQVFTTGLTHCKTEKNETNACNQKDLLVNDDEKKSGDDENLVGLNLIYHAAKSADGSKHLRVIRNVSSNNNKTKVLCGNRVSQMTRAYDDIEAVTRLLEEKEKDLELTVQIGKELLTQNNTLENRISELEADLKTSNDDRAQLVHELHKKNELIAVLTNDAEDGSEAGETPTFSKSVTLDLLQKRVNSLQDENKSLKMEASQLAKQTDDVEEHERQLMEDITAQLNAANSQYDGLSLELERQREENRLQHEQIVSLTARLAEAEMRLHQLTHDNDEHVSLLNITKENQNSLALELVEFKQRYQEVLALLQETQEQLRKQRKRAMPQARSGSFMCSMGANGGGMTGSGYGNGFLQPESLQSELMESSMFSENSMDSGISADRERANDRIGRLMSQLASGNGNGGAPSAAASALGGASLMSSGIAGGAMLPYHQRVFDTVRSASKNGNYADSSGQIGAMSMSSASGPRISSMALPAGSYYRHDSIYDGGMGNKTLSCESLASQSDENYPTNAPVGVPGAPGAKDLEAALKRLTPAEVLARRAMLSYAPAGTYNYDEQQQQNHQQKYQQKSATSALPMGVRTPDSILSTGSSGISSSHNMSAGSSMHQWRLPERLQIVKPMEGSQTLHHWSRLATPTLSGLLEERPGVTIRGGRGLDDLGMQIYTLEDVEEDFNDDLPGKQFDTPGCTYTYTNSMVMHPDDGFVNDLSFLSQSQMSSRMASTTTSRQPSCPPTPRSGLSRKNSCSTFSVNLGLASMLNERGIKAVTPSALNTPAGPNFSPTVTPCNSPEGSPTRSRSPEPLFGLLSSGADLIRRKLMGGYIERPTRNQQKQQQQKVMLSRLERRALGSLRLVEKCESIGLENIVAPQPSHGIVNRSSSPLSQLGSLKSLHTSSNSIVDDIHFERDQIRSVLNKGLNSHKQNAAAGAAAGTSSSSSSAYNSDNDDTISASGSDSSFRHDVGDDDFDEHRTPTNKNTAAKTKQPANNSSNSDSNSSNQANAQNKQTTISQSTTTITTGGTLVPLPSQTEARIKQMQRQKSRRNLKNGIAAQRPDLGTINSAGGSGRVRNDLGRVYKNSTTAATATTTLMNAEQRRAAKSSPSTEQLADSGNASEVQQSYTQSFVGTVSSLLFGRKGGWL